MKITLHLLKLFLDNRFSLKDFLQNFRKGGKETGKNIAYIALFLYVAVVFGGMLFFYVTTLYGTFKEAGIQSFVLLLLSISATFLTLIFGFLQALSMYVTNSTEENLLALPLSPKSLFAAKFLQIYVIELLLGAAILLFGTGIYGFYEGLLTSPVFYITAITGSLTLPLIPITITFILLVAIFSAGKSALNKKVLTVISTVMLIGVMLGFNFFYQKSLQNLNDSAYILEMYESGNFSIVNTIAAFYPPAQWYVSAITANNISSILPILLLLTLPSALAFLCIVVLAKPYVKSIIGFNEESSKKMNKEEAREFLSTDIKSTPLFWAVFKRDILTVLKEPSFFFNGPFVIILLPVVMAISVLGTLPKDGLDGLRTVLSNFGTADFSQSQLELMFFIITGILSAMIVFMGTSTSISATAFSREGKGLAVLKALPIPVKTLLTAKIGHAMIYAVFALLLIGIPSLILLHFEELHISSANIILIMSCTVLLSMSLCFLMHLLDIWIDTARPKLNWETPTSAFKQNLNSVISVFLSMGLIILLAVLAIFVLKKTMITLILLSCVILIGDIILWRVYVRWAEKRLAAMEV
ncbi:MAG TPA: hypothetical protein PLV89_10515 [Treponemataceae bacterium]|jgi:ABC-2 type transport system permease protein|nr:hypothetical protein [Treponemataceae bacterium]